MIQRGEQLPLSLEARAPIGIACEGVRKNLDRNIAPESRVTHAIHLTQTALPEQGPDFVRAESAADRERDLN